MTLGPVQLREAIRDWIAEELVEPDVVMRLVLRRRARDFGPEDGPEAFLESYALSALGRQGLVHDGPHEQLDVLLAEACVWAEEVSAITRDVQHASGQMDFGVESLVQLGRAIQDALRLGALSEERVQHALWWKLHLLADDGRSRFWHWKGRVREVRPGLSRELAHRRRDALRAQLAPWCGRAERALAKALTPAIARLNARLQGVALGSLGLAEADLPDAHVASCVRLLEVPDPFSKRSGKVSPWAIRVSYPGAVAAYVRELLLQGCPADRLVLLLPESASPQAWQDHGAALQRVGAPYSAPWGPSWARAPVVRAWLQLLSFAQAPAEALHAYAVLVGPALGEPDTLQPEKASESSREALRRLAAAAVGGPEALLDAWLNESAIGVWLEHTCGAGWMRAQLDALRGHMSACRLAGVSSLESYVTELQASLRRQWPGAPMVGVEGGVRLVPSRTYGGDPNDIVFLCEPTEAKGQWAPRVAPSIVVLASVQQVPVGGWASAAAKGETDAWVHAAPTQDTPLGDLVRAELLRPAPNAAG